MMKSNSPNNDYFNQDKLQALSDLVCDRLEDFLDELAGISHKKRGTCIVHGGDNPTAFEVSDSGYWKCYTHGCHKKDKWGGSIFSLVRGVLSDGNLNSKVSWVTTVDYVCKFAGVSLADIHIDHSECQKTRFIKSVEIITKHRHTQSSQITRDKIRSRLVIPAHYYLERGYCNKVLDEYDIGFCQQTGKEMTGRVVVPVYDDNHQFMIGCSGRSIHSQCPKCKHYHSGTVCPSTPAEKYQSIKWIHSKGFSTNSCLYNYWNAKTHIAKDGFAILVEGPGNVWRLVEAGFKHSLAIFGAYLKDEQQLILEQSGAMSLIVMTDNDEAGRNAALQIKEQCGRLYRLYFPNLSGNDAGEMQVDTLTNELLPIVNALKEINYVGD